MRRFLPWLFGVALALGAATALAMGMGDGPLAAIAVSADEAGTHTPDDARARDPDVPALPFADNLDPFQCGIPVRWGLDDPAWLTGVWDGQMVQLEVLLYDSHLRVSIAGRAPHGAEVEVIMFQENPTLDYYLVRTVGDTPPAEGWVPAPFLSFEPVS